MALDLKAVIRLEDKFSAPMRRIQRVMERTKRITEQMNRATNLFSNSQARLASESRRASFSIKQLGSEMKVAKEGISGLAGKFTGLAAAIGGAYAAQKLFNATIGQAARYERSQGLITAMMGDVKKAKQFMEEIEKMAINSPLLNSQDMMAAASAFLPMTKDLNRLKKLYDLSERLYVLNDQQGMEGASFALREFLMGKDATSLVERFNLNRKVLNDLKNLSFDEAVKGLDELLNKMGVTRKTIETIGTDTLAKWSQIKERLARTFRQIGEPSLKVVNNFLTGLLNRFDSGDLTRFANVGANIVKQIITGLTNTATKIYDWFSTISKSEEFQKRTTLWGKVSFMFDDLYKRFTEWLKNDGSKKIESMTSTLITAVSKALQNNSAIIAKAALTVGAKIGSAMARGIMDAISKNPIAQFLIGGAGPVVGAVYPSVKKWYDKLFSGDKKSKNSKSSSTRTFYNPRLIKGYYHGLDYVPYDRFPALLHKGEMVLTRKEADEYRKSGNGGRSVQVSIGQINLHGVGGDMRKAARELMKIMADELERVGANMARV
jgi:hypothetical protein